MKAWPLTGETRFDHQPRNSTARGEESPTHSRDQSRSETRAMRRVERLPPRCTVRGLHRRGDVEALGVSGCFELEHLCRFLKGGHSERAVYMTGAQSMPSPTLTCMVHTGAHTLSAGRAPCVGYQIVGCACRGWNATRPGRTSKLGDN